MIEQNALMIVFGIFLVFTCRDVFYGQHRHDESSNLSKPPSQGGHLHHNQHNADGPQRAYGELKNHHMASVNPNLKIQFCQSCGYRQAFEDISKMLTHQFPQLKVEGEIHQPSWLKSQIVNLLFISKIAVLGMIYMDFNPFNYFSLETPSIWAYMSRSKVSSSLMIFFLANSIESNMMSTGAFEIFFNDMPLWSKIHTGRMPTAPELIQMVQAQLSLGQPSRLGDYLPK